MTKEWRESESESERVQGGWIEAFIDSIKRLANKKEKKSVSENGSRLVIKSSL